MHRGFGHPRPDTQYNTVWSTCAPLAIRLGLPTLTAILKKRQYRKHTHAQTKGAELTNITLI